MEMEIEEVWSWNFEHEMSRIEEMVLSYPYISFDTEFPGFLRNSPRHSSQLDRYEDLKFNVDRLKIIQLGLSISDENGNRPISGGVWQFNFNHFNPKFDFQVSSSIELLQRNGINLEKNFIQGIDVNVFSSRFTKILLGNRSIKWITFHGFYDLAYAMKLVMNKPMPYTLGGFLSSIDSIFGHVYDVKYMAGLCQGMRGGEIGLERLAKILKVERIGSSHQAGSDSLLTTCCFWKMKTEFDQLTENKCDGFLYGISLNMHNRSYFVGYPIGDQYCNPVYPQQCTNHYSYPVYPQQCGTFVHSFYLPRPMWKI